MSHSSLIVIACLSSPFSRNKLGRALNRSGPVAVVGILNYDGAESIVAEMRALRDSLAAQLRERRAAIGSA